MMLSAEIVCVKCKQRVLTDEIFLEDANVHKIMPSVIVSTDRYLLSLYFLPNTIILRMMFAIKEPCLFQ